MKHKILILFIYIFSIAPLFAQNTKKADKAFESGDYVRAIEEYSSLIELTEDSQSKARFKFLIGESYRRINRPDKAERSLSEAIKGGYASGDVYFSLGDSQLKLGKYDEALLAFEAYKRSNPSDPLANAGIASAKFAKENAIGNPFFEIFLLDKVNSRKNEFGISYFNDGLIFSSTRPAVNVNEDKEDDDSGKNEVYTRTGVETARVFISAGNNGVFARPIEITELNKMKDFAKDGIFSYDPYSRQGLYARFDGKRSYIQFMQLKNNKWEKTEKIEIDSKKEPIGHPFVTPNGNRVYFTSTMPGGYGKSDIWYIERNGKGWSKPVNAGEQINTSGNEVFPAIAGDYFFFASDGRIGFGGFDLYASKIVDGTLQKSYNLGRPFNSPSDDYNIVMRTDLQEGDFVSGRHEKWGDDIFYFKGFPFCIIASGVIKNAETGKPISNVTVELIDQINNQVMGKFVTGVDGKYSIFVAPEQKYILRTTVAGYAPISKKFETNENRFGFLNTQEGLNLDFTLSANTSVISGKVYARRTFMPIENQKITLSANGKVLQTTRTNVDGIYKFGDIVENTQYTITTSPKNYFSGTKQFSVGRISSNTEFNKANGYDNDFALETLDLNKEVLMENVLFSREKSNLLSESFPELDRLAIIFSQNPQHQILISAYTDARVNSKLAQELTARRAEAVKSYLVSRGVNAGQLSTKGMSKNRLLISNARNEAEHDRNNRVTYMVTKILETTEQDNTPSFVSQTPTDNKQPSIQQPVNNTTKPTTTPPVTITPPAATNGDDYAALPFRVQVSALKALDLSNPTFKRIKNELGMEVRYAVGADGWYRYYVGGFATRDEAAQAVQKLKSIKIDGNVKPKSAF